ncbi:peptidoglycan recognition family protein, partial [Streptomyces sp. Ru87]|uniref:peptidoglycan recognition protein family protein n=1 Tax=Streptomyces sp. Ru87 TaxID=2044307 RepID=UPI0027B8856A
PKHRRPFGMSRRGALGAAGAVAAAAAVTPLAAAVSGDEPAGEENSGSERKERAFPATRAKLADDATRPVSADFPITYVGLGWRGPHRGAQIRFTLPDGRKSDWQRVTAGCAGGREGSAGGAVTALAAAPDATGYELRLPDGVTEVRAMALDTVHGPRRTTKVPAERKRMRGLTYLTRADWGADESLRFLPDGTENTPTAFYPAQVMTVHHTATVNDDPDPAATVRAVYEQHAVANDWGDIGYHFLIDEAGRIYEGRWSGEDALPAHDSDGKLVTAFHTAGYNSGNLGVALLGDFVEREPTAEARASLVALLAVYAAYQGLDPRADVTFVNPVDGVTKDTALLSGHQDWLTTECPGGVLHRDLPALREDVAAAAGRMQKRS